MKFNQHYIKDIFVKITNRTVNALTQTFYTQMLFALIKDAVVDHIIDITMRVLH